MIRVRTVFRVLLCIQCFLHQVLGHLVDETFENDIPNWKCDSNLDCVVPSTTCNNGTCQCSAGYVYDGSMTSCIKVATTYGDVCEESIQCSRYLYHGGTCMNSICVCAEGYYYMHGRCNVYSGLFGKCRKDDDCYVNGNFGAASCVGGTCKCSPGYYQREYRDCRPEAKGVGDQCLIDNDCRFNSTAYCNSDYVCALPTKDGGVSKSISDEDVFQDISVSQIGNNAIGNCTSNGDCNHLGNAFCDPSGTCACQRAHFFVEEVGKCVPELGEQCQPSDTVVIEYSKCLNGRWSCEIQTVASKDNRICEKAIRKYNNYCNTDNQCYIFGPDGVCKENKCTCNENSRFNSSELFCWIKRGIDGKCQQDGDCYINDNNIKLSCTKNVCTCPSGTHSNSNKTTCVENSAGLGKNCEVNKDCATKNAECVNGICTCKENYYKSYDQCQAGINSTCTFHVDCKPRNSHCVYRNANDSVKTCTCKEQYVATSTSSCKPVLTLGSSCDEDIQCSSEVPNSICISRNGTTERSCGCPEGRHYRCGECFKRKVLGMECDSIGECYLDTNVYRAICKNGRCSCDWKYIEAGETECLMRISYEIVTPPDTGNITKVSPWLLPLLLFLTNYFAKLEY